MSCVWIEKISSLIDGELPPAEARGLERHVVECGECQRARADFLTFRSQIAAYSPALDLSASHETLGKILERDSSVPVVPARGARSVPLFGAFRFGPTFAVVAVLMVAGIVGLEFYRGTQRQIQNNPSTDELLANKKSATKTPAPKVPSSRSSSPIVTDSSGAATAKPTGGRRPKPKVRPSIDIPKPRTPPDDLISPWRNQAIADNNATKESVSETPSVGTDRSADAETLTARHLEQSELLLRSFRNVRTAAVGAGAEVAYERQRAQRLVYQNILLRREADAAGDVQVASLLDSLEPILLDIANLPDKPQNDQVSAIKERLKRQNLVAMLQVNSTALARAND